MSLASYGGLGLAGLSPLTSLTSLDSLGGLDLLGGLGHFGSLAALGNQCCDEPIVLSRDVPVPQPVALRQCVAPRPFLPYSRRTRRGYPRW